MNVKQMQLSKHKVQNIARWVGWWLQSVSQLIRKRFKVFLVQNKVGGCPHGAMVKAMNCGIVLGEFVLQSCYYVHFYLGKGMNPLILPSMG